MLKLALLNIAIFQGIIIGLVLLYSPFFKNKTNQYLSFAIFSLSWSLLNLVLDITQTFESYPFLIIIDIIDSGLLFPVLIMLFVIHQVNHPQKHSKHLIWLFTPFLFSIVSSILNEISTEIKETGSANFINAISDILEVILFLLNLFFIPFVLIKTYKYIQYSKRNQEKKWLTFLWIFEVAFLGSWLLALLLSPFIEHEISNAMHIIALFTTLLVHWIAYSGVYKLKLANDQEKIRAILFYHKPQVKLSSVIDSSTLSKSTKITKEPKPTSKENMYYQKLEKLCSDQKIYRDPTLDRNTVAEMLGISPSYFSQIVNSITDENFATYINRYRVMEAKELILDKKFDNYSLLAIGLECGFSSKTTFYNSFKKLTGMTPNNYRKDNR
ncbi:helix-turn-helix domain-containing protein [Aquimarina sediminis]|uniref:helix-turn-helix domain-containing protein n=1 Tax=Aquimarina sediminis TaxID=2070536 RepID=UPI000CA075B9|nr:helix-turn-helix domain-containing protein [Aquimarina sediminis]